MPLPSPILDNRSYQQLRDELVRRIPVYTPEWTDHNASDPGITLIELFAFLAENLLFRFNQIPESVQLAYLKLLQIPLRPAVPARSLLTMGTDIPAGVLVPIGTEAKAGNTRFETETEAHVWPLTCQAVARSVAPAPDPSTEPEAFAFAVRSVDAISPLPAGSTPTYYQNSLTPADGVGTAVDFTNTVDGILWIAILKTKATDAAALADGLLTIGFIPDPITPAIEDVEACPGTSPGTPGGAVEWQASTGEVKNGKPVYRSLTVGGDTTRALRQEGVVTLRLPKDPSQPLNPVGLGVFALSDPDQLGTGDFPPALDDETEKNILFWIRGFRLDQSRIGKVQFVCVNATTVNQSVLARPEFLGTGAAQPDQRFKLANKPVLEQSVVVEVEDATGRFVPWSEVDDFAASRPDDLHYRVDSEAGEVIFGNGLEGLAPQIGARIRAREYRYGGGAAGNVGAKGIAKVAVGGVKDVANPLPAHGGADAETIEAALARIPGELRRRDRAVTRDDFRELALATPGSQVGRAECLPRFHAPTKTPERPGVVSVVIWPRQDAKNPNAPRPDRALLGSVCKWLDARRLVTTELYVIPPTYRKVAVSVGLEVKPGFGAEAVRQWVELAIRQYLAPLPPYGPSGEGWPLGRRVYGPELEGAALQVEGVEFLTGLNVAGFNAATGTWVQGTVNLEPYEVPELAAIAVAQGAPGPAGDGFTPVVSGTPIPVPVIREVC